MPGTPPDLPALFKMGDQIAQNGKNSYILLVATDLLFIAIGALLAMLWPDSAAEVVSAVLVGFGVLNWAAISFGGFDREWYGGRALAESVKTLAWRYMTVSEPFADNADAEASDRLFLDRLQSLLEKRRGLRLSSAGPNLTGDQITVAMRDVRGAPLADRAATYVEHRVRSQRDWYARESRKNSRRHRAWLALLLLAQVGAFVFAVLAASRPNDSFSGWLGVVTTIAAGVIAWMGVRRHGELGQAYSIACTELGIIDSLASHVHSDAQLSKYVLDAENAMSREHTLWFAKREDA